MAKDPAFLFYPGDFLTGVQDLTMEERGQYITLLCLQHQKGHLTEKMIRLSCGNAAADVMAKFRQDAEGLFFNERLDIEIEKRRAHGEKQRDRAIEGWKKRKSEAGHSTGTTTADAAALPLENENRNEDVNEGRSKNKRPRPKKVLPELTYPFDTPEFMTAWSLLMSEKNWRSKSENALQLSLITLSKHPADVAIKMIHDCIEGGWKKLVEPNNKYNGYKQNGSGKASPRDMATEASIIAEQLRNG